MSGSNKNLFIVGAVVIFLGFLYMSRKKSETTVAPAPVARGQATTPHVSSQPQILEMGEKPEASSSLQATRIYNQLAIAGAIRVPSVPSGDKLKFRIRNKVVSVMNRSGDFDYLKGKVKNTNEKVFVLSIEPLKGDKSKSVRHRLSLSDIAASKSFDGVLPVDSDGRDYGVYLCFDAKKTNECASKKPLSNEDWNTNIGGKSKSADKIFYFQMLSVRGSQIYLIPSYKWNKASIHNLKSALKPIMETTASLDKLQEYMDSLGSMPGRVSQNQLELQLPHRDL